MNSMHFAVVFSMVNALFYEIAVLLLFTFSSVEFMFLGVIQP